MIQENISRRAFLQLLGLERIVREEVVDFIQVNYNLAVRHAERSLFPAALDNGVAVIVDRPYEGGSLFSKVRGQELPG